MNKAYRIIYEEGIGEIEEKKSRFICRIRPVHSEEEALSYIAYIKKQCWNATHNCYAYVIGKNQELMRCSDDGEPQGTAGRPMLDVLLNEEIHDAVAIVTRYFGGTLLGTGGLVRAYQKAVQEGLENCVVVEKQLGIKGKITCDYSLIGKIQYLMRTNAVLELETTYGEGVEVCFLIPKEQFATFCDKVIEATSATCTVESLVETYFGDALGECVLFDE